MPIPDEATVRAKLRTFVRDTFLYMKPKFQLNDDDRLLQKGVVDSMGVMEVLTFMETEFSVTVPGEDLTEENLGSISAMAGYLAGRARK